MSLFLLLTASNDIAQTCPLWGTDEEEEESAHSKLIPRGRRQPGFEAVGPCLG